MSEPRRVATGPVLLLAGVLALGAADAFLVAISTGIFGGAYNAPALRGFGSLAAFALLGMLLDAFLLAVLFAGAWWLGRLLRLTDVRRIAFAAAIAGFLPLAFFVVSHQIHRIFGHVVGIGVLLQLAGGEVSDAAVEAITEAPGAALLLAAAFVGTSLAVHWAGRAAPRLRARAVLLPPTGRGLAFAIGATGVLGAAALLGSARNEGLARGLEHKASGRLVGLLVRVATDFDFDGYGMGSRPPDLAPFDPARHPYAREVAGNGIDENGVAGDLPLDFRPLPPFPAPERPAAGRRPSFLLIFLESFRGDVVGLRFGDREVTPVLNALARAGASSERAYAHNPLTSPSRAALFQGSIVPRGGGRSLIDDFHDLGYRVAYFSGQNDLHGNSDVLVGYGRADRFYDARADQGRRTSRTTMPVSLQVSSAVVLEHVRAYLAETASDPRPLFLYVNLVDNHYPYQHEGLERLLGVEPVSRSEIRPENAQRVFETYLQAVANVDRAVGGLIQMWEGHTGGAPLLVTADHGQAFYEAGMLGHGQAIDETQSRVPLIVDGIGGVWPEPLGLYDVRGLLLTHLFEAPGRARFELDPTRSVFQFVGPLEQPALVALRGATGAAAFELATASARDADDSAATPPAAPVLARVLWTWEYWQAQSAAFVASR